MFKKKNLALYIVFLMIAILVGGICLPQAKRSRAANSYLPHWEHIPDGEPRVFEDPDNPGKYRVYIYGSHDTRKTGYCGYDLVTWSAPVDDLNNWRYEGVIFESIVNGNADVLFAPDVVETKDENGNKTYYLYPNNQSSGSGRTSMIAKSDSPKGPFEVCNWKDESQTKTDGILGFDPAAFVDDDGRVYGYWGFQSSSMAELDPETMCTLKAGSKILTEKDTGIDGSEGDNFRFFEASSMRKVKDKYVFVYSRKTKEGEFGLGASNYTLAYAYGDTPLGPWTYGGTLVDGRARETDQNGKVICSQMSYGNTHGSILEINGQWYLFYHRCINNDMYSRQATVEAIDVNVTEDGEVQIKEAEVTSQGFEINGLNPFKKQTAGSACFMTGGPYIKAHYDTSNPGSDVVNIKNGSIVGYKYFNFDLGKGTRDKDIMAVNLIPKGKDGTIKIMLDRPWERDGGTEIGSIEISATDDPEGVLKTAEIDSLSSIEGKHALYFVFKSSGSSVLCDLSSFQFGDSTVTDEDEGQDVKPEESPAPDETPLPTPTPVPGNTVSPSPAVPSPTVPPAANQSEASLAVGKVHTIGNFTYKITKADTYGKGTVLLVGTKNKKIKSIQVPDTIKIKGTKFRVAGIGKAAFKGCKLATRAVIGKYVSVIENSAFESCGKLKKINLKTTTLKKIGKKVFKGIHKKAQFTVPKKQLKKYKKMLKSAKVIKKSMKISG